MVILKADDLGFQPGMASFRRLIDIGVRRRIPHSLGVITNRLQHLLPRELHYLRACFEDPLLELWNHSHTHRNLTTLTHAQQSEDIQTAQKIIREQLGVDCSVFGAPYNKYNPDSLAALEECAEIEAVYLVEPALAQTSRLVNAARPTLVSPEFVRPSTRQNDLKEFIRRCQLLNNADLMVVQFHPPAWNEHGFKVYEQCLDYLLEQGVRFVTMGDYVALQKSRSEENIDLPLRAAAMALDARLDSSASALREKYAGDRRLSTFFFNRHQLGTQHVLRCLERIGFDAAPEQHHGVSHGARYSCLDIGCGAGNWLIGYGLLHPQAGLCGLDALAPCADIAQTQLTQAGMGTRSTIHCGTVDQPPLFEQRFDRVWCINAGQYMDKEALFSYAHQALKHRGAFFLNIQTIDYFICAAMQHLSQAQADHANAAGRLETLIGSFAQRAAVRTPFGSVRAYDHEELTYCAKQHGLAMVVEGIQFEDMIPEYRGFPMMKSYLMENVYITSEKKGPDAFLALSAAERRQHLQELRHFGMWRSLRTLHAECRDAIGEDQRAELGALVQVMSDVPFQRMQTGSTAEFSRATRAALAINHGDFEAPALYADTAYTDKKPDAEISFLKNLSAYLRGDFRSVIRECQRHQQESEFELRLAVLAAAACCRANETTAANNAIDYLYNRRHEVVPGIRP